MPYERSVGTIRAKEWTVWNDQASSSLTLEANGNRYIWGNWINHARAPFTVTASNDDDWLNDTWTSWNSLVRYNQTYTITANYIWDNWNETAGTNNAWHVDHGVTAAQVREAHGFGAPALVRSEADWAVIREEQDRQRRIRDAAQAEARAEARKLMAVVLSKEQMNDYLALGYFTVVGSEGGVFRIYHGTSGNLKQVVNGEEVNALCVHPRLHDGEGYLPTEDSMIAQAFAIMHDELGTVQQANVHRGPRHLRAVPVAA